MRVLTGLDGLVREGFSKWRGRKVAALCHHASITQDRRHLTDVLRQAGMNVHAILSPEHGLWGGRDTRISTTGAIEARSGFVVHSLYGETNRPTAEMLKGVEVLFLDLQDVGARFYTYTWSMAHCLAACEEFGIHAVVLDRPNPIGGVQFEGPVLDPAFSSFIGLHPVPQRHGMTHGELANWLKSSKLPQLRLEVAQCEGWTRKMCFSETGLTWIPPSPNMPRPETALVYPGMGLFEGTDLSEGRGTTRPFEMVGHPELDGWKLADRLQKVPLPGVRFRPVCFQPTWSKHVGKVCGGCFMHVLDSASFRPVQTAIAVLLAVRELDSRLLGWDQETRRSRFDRLAGCSWLREDIDVGLTLASICDRMAASCREFAMGRDKAMIYP